MQIQGRLPRLVAGLAMAGGAGVGFLAVPASATPGQAQTLHAHGTDAFDQVVIDFLPIDSPPGISLPNGCWFPGNTSAFVSTDGNLILHEIGNKNGGWFTSTYTGDAAVYPIVFASPGIPKLDSNGNDVVDTSATPAATGHLTIWDGDESNKQNEVSHATLTFKGTDSSGNPVSMTAHFQFATNAAG